MLHTLERMLGWEMLQRIMSTFFARWKFKHPRPEDFFAVANEVSGKDLTWFFDQVYRSSNDIRLRRRRRSTSERAGDARIRRHRRRSPPFEERTQQGTYRTTVVVRRYGEAFFPVDVLTTFENGEQVREKWDGRERWRRFTYDRPSRARDGAGRSRTRAAARHQLHEQQPDAGAAGRRSGGRSGRCSGWCGCRIC